MAKYFYRVSCGPGMDRTGIIETEAETAVIDEYLYQLALDNASDFGYETDEDHFGDLETVGRDWDDELEEYDDQSELQYGFDPYDEEEHSGSVYSAEDIEYL